MLEMKLQLSSCPAHHLDNSTAPTELPVSRPSELLHKLYSSFSSTFRVGPSGLFPIRINLELLVLQTVGRAPWTGDQPVARPLPAQDNTNTK
jgi:hypothetical protein